MNLSFFTVLISRRASGDWVLLAGVLAGMVLATTIAAATPLYLKSIERLAFTSSLDQLHTRYLDFNVFASHIPFTVNGLEETDVVMDDMVVRHISEITTGRERFLKGAPYFVGLPRRSLPERRGLGSTGIVGRGYFQSFTNLEKHSRFVSGRMAVDSVTGGPGGPTIEAVVSLQTSQKLRIGVDDMLTLTASIGANNTISVRIVGVIEPVDITDIYWSNARTFLDPEPLTEILPPGLTVPADEPPLPLFVARSAMVDAMEIAYPGLLVYGTSITSIHIDTELLKDWSLAKSRRRLGAFERDISRSMPGVSATTGLVQGVVDEVERRGFFSTVPLLLLAVVMVSTILILLSIMVSYLAQNRETDTARLRSRGIDSMQVIKLYLSEGVTMVLIAIITAPPIAIIAVIVTGKLPLFQNVEGYNSLVPVIRPEMFVSVMGMGLVCLILFTTIGVLNTRGNLLAQKLRVARPPMLPLIHRYYVDVAILVLGGLVFWELRSRGHIISGGMFEELNVNEALLLAPVLFMVAVALIFMRVFPLLIKFISGESSVILHWVLVISVIGMTGVVVLNIVDGDEFRSTVTVLAFTLVMGFFYWVTYRAGRRFAQWVGICGQFFAVGVLVIIVLPNTDDAQLWPAITFAVLVPAQIIFRFLRVGIRSAPVWLSMSLWNVSRNPNPHTWTVLLLVLSVGLGVLATSVGETLERSQVDRFLYKTPSDIRVSGISRFMEGGMQSVKQQHIDTGEVHSAAMALRTVGRLGQVRFGVLGIEAAEFLETSWYRKDFSVLSLPDVMRSLQVDIPVHRVILPEAVSNIAMWIRSSEKSESLFLEIVIKEPSGTMHTLSLGKLGNTRWHLMSADIPSDVVQPIEMVSIQVFELMAGDVVGIGGPPPTSGTLFVDDVHATLISSGQSYILEDFEGQNRWTAIETSISSDDVIYSKSGVGRNESTSGVFSYGSYRNNSVRGFYMSETGGAVPVLASSSFLKATGFRIGDRLVARISGRLTPLLIKDSVSLFPTMTPESGGFLLADLDLLLGYINMFGRPNRIQPNELYVRRADISGSLETLLSDLKGKMIRVEFGASGLGSVLGDPFWVGWRAVVVISLLIGIIVANAGYISYILGLAFRNRGEMASLQGIGLSHYQRACMIALQHMTMVVIGLGLGVWTGRQMSVMMVAPLAIGDGGETVIPPFLLITDWTLVALSLAMMVTGFSVALYFLSRRFGRLDIYLLARAGLS